MILRIHGLPEFGNRSSSTTDNVAPRNACPNNRHFLDALLLLLLHNVYRNQIGEAQGDANRRHKFAIAAGRRATRVCFKPPFVQCSFARGNGGLAFLCRHAWFWLGHLLELGFANDFLFLPLQSMKLGLFWTHCIITFKPMGAGRRASSTTIQRRLGQPKNTWTTNLKTFLQIQKFEPKLETVCTYKRLGPWMGAASNANIWDKYESIFWHLKWSSCDWFFFRFV